MPVLETREFTGKSGKTYTMNVYPGDVQFNDFIPGVYYMSRVDGDEEQAVYLGESGNIDLTLKKHDKQECLDQHGYNRIAFYRNASKEIRDEVVDDLMPVLSPACNQA